MTYQKPSMIIAPALNAVKSHGAKQADQIDNPVPPVTLSSTNAYEADE